MATIEELNIHTLKEKTGITDNQLDKRINKEHCRRLARLFGSWERYTDTPGLGLRPGQIADIRYCAYQQGNEVAMTRALQLWLTNNPFHTYRQLILIFLELKEGYLAYDIAKFVVEHYPKLEDATITPVQGLITDDITNKITHFEGRFSELITSTLRHLVETNSSLTDIKYSLLALPLAIRNEHEKLLVVKYSLVEEAKSVGGVFAIITSYISYLDYSLLEYIIEKFGSKSLKSQMKLYARDMKQFRANTTISSIIPYLPRRSDLQEGFSALRIKLDFDPDTMTLEDLNEHRKQLASEFLLSDFALLMAHLSEGSVHVVWLIPKSIVSFLKHTVEDKSNLALQKLHILHLSVEDNVLYSLSRTEKEKYGIQASMTEVLDQHEIEQRWTEERSLRTIRSKMLPAPVQNLRLTDSDPNVFKKEETKVKRAVSDLPRRDTSKLMGYDNPAWQTRCDNITEILHETNILAKIQHPNIVRFISATIDPSNSKIVTEFLETSLESSLESVTTQYNSVRDIEPIFTGIARGLTYLHTHKDPIIHRDVRPANIYLLQNGTEAKLSGFKSAIFARDAITTPFCIEALSYTKYIAPELYDNPLQQSTKIDVYAFGIVIKDLFSESMQATYLDFWKYMPSCYSVYSKDRPTMEEILKIWTKYIPVH